MSTTTILHLDDSRGFLEEVSRYLEADGFSVVSCATVSEAIDALARKGPINFAIVDLFLLGERGAELSNEFVANHLQGNYPYMRLTGAPSGVPTEYAGATVMHKRDFLDHPDRLIEIIRNATGW